jgi:hypothetical protein
MYSTWLRWPQWRRPGYFIHLTFSLFETRGRTYPLFEDIISYPYPGPQKGYYILSLSRQKKDMDIYPISFVNIFASIVTVSEQQKARPGSTAAHKSSTFYRIELKP